jgi:PKD repeat protein
MTASSTITSTARRIVSAALALLLAAAALVVLANPASALQGGSGSGPGGGPNDPPDNPPPAARFSISRNPAVLVDPLGATVGFDASASSDDDGIAKYQWDLDGNGSFERSGATLVKPNTIYTTPGIVHVRLKVTDTGGVSRTTEHVLFVQHAPHARLTLTPTVALVGEHVSIDASASTDDFTIAQYDWDLDGDGTFEITTRASAGRVDTGYTTVGTRNVKVRVRDTHGLSSVATATLVVHRVPTAAFTFAPSPAFAGEKVTFDATSSSDDGPIKDYAWDLDGNGTFETDTQASPTASKTYATDGPITVALRVTDEHGAQDTATHLVRVLQRPAGTTGTGAGAGADAKGPIVRISPRSVRLSRKGTITLRVSCPAGERACNGRLTVRTVGAKAFHLGGAQTATLRIHVSRKAQRAIKRHHRLRARATAVTRDAAGNAGTTRAVITIKR